MFQIRVESDEHTMSSKSYDVLLYSPVNDVQSAENASSTFRLALRPPRQRARPPCGSGVHGDVATCNSNVWKKVEKGVVGDAVGDTVGEAVGLNVGDVVGDAVGDAVGEVDGLIVGADVVGELVGDTDGDVVGLDVGADVVGEVDGLIVGALVVGDSVGDMVGDDVGAGVLTVVVAPVDVCTARLFRRSALSSTTTGLALMRVATSRASATATVIGLKVNVAVVTGPSVVTIVSPPLVSSRLAAKKARLY